MTDKKLKNEESDNSEFSKLLEKHEIKVPQVGETVKGIVLTASSAEVRLDIDGVLIGVVRGCELYEEAEEYANLKPGDIIEATVVEDENENGELELSFRFAGHAKAWDNLRNAFSKKEVISVKVVAVNRGGLMATYGQIAGFIPVSQLAPENYPRVSGGDKTKILEKLKIFIGTDMKVRVATLEEDEKEEKIVFSEKDVWNEKQKDVISKYKVGTKVEGRITAITNFGVFVSFDDNLEGLIHISELAWQRIDDPSDLFKVGDKVKAEVINLDGAKIFLSSKKLLKDPWEGVEKKYEIGKTYPGKIIKINPFGLFVELDKDIHGLAHISQLNLASGQKINDLFKANIEMDFEVVSVEPKNHRLGLIVAKDKKKTSSTKSVEKKKEEEPVKKEKKEVKGKEIKTEKKEKKTEKSSSAKATDDKKEKKVVKAKKEATKK